MLLISKVKLISIILGFSDELISAVLQRGRNVGWQTQFEEWDHESFILFIIIFAFSFSPHIPASGINCVVKSLGTYSTVFRLLE